jgi:two-component system, NarL family, response regulator DevR
VLVKLRGEAQLASMPVEHLTRREARILALIAEGFTNRQIAARLELSEKTVKNYVSNVLGKLGLSRRAQAAAYMARRRCEGDEPVP